MLNRFEMLSCAVMARLGKQRWPDSFLTITNTVNGAPSVEDGSSICDFDPEEKAHKYSIESAAIHFEHGGKSFNMLDTPGYPDFIGQVNRPHAGG